MVALKMLNADRQSPHFRELFDAERRVLAQIDHPNVARIWDAGTSHDGRDWVAMEYVPGVPITQYCDQNQLTIQERARLMGSVARAVDFAHEKGVVHRDLKPANILVSVDGGRAVPKIIDFGIARVLGATMGAAEPDRAMGTPGYMAPEQMVSAGADADARADVYSLGAVFYCLCTGGPPADVGSAARAAQPRRLDVPLMSRCVAALPAQEAERVAQERRATPRELAHQLQGDLDWIAAKCLDQNRMRRYSDAGALAEDLRRWHLQRPVDAVPNTLRYRTHKFVQRNRVAVVLVSLLGFLCVAGLIMSVLGWSAALRERNAAAQAQTTATEQATEARAAVDFITGVLSAASLNQAPGGVALTVVDLLRQAAHTADQELQSRPAADAAVRLALGKTYTSLGLLDEARVQLIRATTLAEGVYTRRSAPVAECLQALAEVDLARHHALPARALATEARSILEELPGSAPTALAINSMLLAHVDLEDGKPQAALARLVTSQAEAQRETPANGALLASVNWYRALAYLDMGQFQDALEAIDTNLTYNRAHLPSDHWWIAESETVHAAALAGLGKSQEAWTLLQRAMPTLELALSPTGPVMRAAYARAAFVAEKSGHAEESSTYLQKAHRPPRQLPATPRGTPGAAARGQYPS
jgi:tetratricopeptide (TPR) repeat protein